MTSSRRRALIKLIIFMIILLGFAGIWRWSPLSRWLTVDQLGMGIRRIQHLPFLPLIIMAFYVIGGLLMVPVTLLITVTAIVFNGFTAAAYALGGAVLSSMACYAVGTRLGSDALRTLTGDRLDHLNRRIAKHGIPAIAVLRNIPVAPFSIVNFLAGASRIDFKNFIIGTFIGMMPGVLVITLFSRRVVHVIQEPRAMDIGITIVLAVFFAGVVMGVRKRFFRKSYSPGND